MTATITEDEGQQYGLQLVEFLDMLNTEHKTALDAKDELIDELRQDKERLQNQLDRSWLDRLLGR